ncbi:MAG: HesA/MoeB/ThiF family protein [Chitinophagaceae bacterium]|jgi:adenylyltransferase/sulfurtransferase|nr:HesA/MoeB/ThiF family protein [Chitinophagaceae bacterium]
MEKNERYSSQIRLNGFGEAAQEKLFHSKVLVVGAGGLGCPALQYLAAAGVGKLGIIDHDIIELHNLQRQVLYATNEIGLFKAQVAAKKLRLLNPEIEIQEQVLFLTAKNVRSVLEDYEIIVDCTDNFAVRYLLCDACRLLDKPLIFGAIFRYEGQLAVFNVADDLGKKTTYRHLFPSPPNPLDAPDCNVAGVLGVLPGVIGTMQATETIKILTGIGEPLRNKLMTIDLLNNSSLILAIPVALPEGVKHPTSLSELETFDYIEHCGLKLSAIESIAPDKFLQLCGDANTLIIDVRNIGELPALPVDHIQIPLPELPHQLKKINKKQIVVVCQTGKRSLAAAHLLRNYFGQERQISHLEGGVETLKTILL